MVHGSNPPPSRPCSPSRDCAPHFAITASEPLRDSNANDRENAVIFGVGGRFQARYFNVIDAETLTSSRKNMAFRDGNLPNVTP